MYFFANIISSYFNSHWLILCFVAPMLWALVNIFDVYLVKGVYSDEWDGTIIFGFFQIIPALIIFIFLANSPVLDNFSINNFYGIISPLFLAFLGGFLFNLAFYFYYRALFQNIDVALLQVIWSLTIITVPLLAFILFSEKLFVIQYLGMGITLLGALLLSANKAIRVTLSKRYLLIMLGAILFFSLSMVCEDHAYASLGGSVLGEQGFLFGYLAFSFGAIFCAIIFALWSKRNPFPMLLKYFKIFILLEGVNFLGNFASQRAIGTAPSVSFVAMIETFVPVFILIFSVLIIFYLSFIVKKNTDLVKRIYKEQLGGWPYKVIAIIIMSIGVYIIS